MYDSIDGKKTSILKDVDTTCSDSTCGPCTYAHKDGLTINTGGSCVYVKAPEFIEPVIINSPIYSQPALKDECSERFDMLRKNRMVVSYYKYGPIKENYGNKLVSAVKNLEKRLELYKETGNTEYLADVANFAMIEFMYPQHPEAHFNNLSESPGLGGMTYREIEQL